MARLGCKCGHTMGGSECPSPYNYYVYYADEVTNALADNKNLRLIDFITNWDDRQECRKEYMTRKEPVDYWYCTECKRVYECQAHSGGHWLRVYRREDDVKCETGKQSLVRLYAFSEVHSDNTMEEKPDISLAEYVFELPVDFYASADETIVYAFNRNSETPIFAYVLEETLPSVLPEGLSYQEYIESLHQ